MVSGRYLSFAEREDIAIWHALKLGVREIAQRLGRSPSTISRELRRKASTRTFRLEYRASLAQWHADRRPRRPKLTKLAVNERLRAGCRTGPPASFEHPMAVSWGRRVQRGKAATSRTAATVVRCKRGARSRLGH
jgi:IS30 family transposase